MYRIDIYKSALFLVDIKDKSSIVWGENTQFVNYHGDPNRLLKYVYILEKSFLAMNIIIVTKDLSNLKKVLKKLFVNVKAAGGLVLNDRQEILFIYKKNWWGLPKGKLKKREAKKVAALREVEEETGVRGLMVHSKLGKTRIIKKVNGQRIFKVCTWYQMSSPNQPLKPQLEEGIEKAIWLDIKTYNSLNVIPYYSLQYVLDFLPFIDLSPKKVVGNCVTETNGMNMNLSLR